MHMMTIPGFDLIAPVCEIGDLLLYQSDGVRVEWHLLKR
jgi:hypothetical protein